MIVNEVKVISSKTENSKKWPQILAVIIVSIGSFINGAIVNWTSPSIPILISNMSHIEQMTLEQASYFTVIPFATAIIVSPILTGLADKIGRKYSLILLAVSYLLSWVLIILATNPYIFYISRIFEGIGDTAIFTAVPMYIGEITEPSIRGSWGNLIAVSMFFGYFVLNIIGAYCNIITTACIFAAITAFQIPLLIFLPESPYFLLMKNREEEAETALKFFRRKKDVKEELAVMAKGVHQDMAETTSIKDIFCVPINLKTLLISVGIRTTQPFSGSPAFTMYTQYMFLISGSDLSASTSAIIFSGTFAVFMSGFSFTVEKYGRKPLMIFSSFGCSAILLIVSIYFFISEHTTVDVSTINWLPLVGMFAYVPFSSAGFTLIPNLMLSELFPTNIKANALCILNIWFFFLLIIVTKLFQVLSSLFGLYVSFGLFAVTCFLSGIYSITVLPETKGKTLEEIQLELKGIK